MKNFRKGIFFANFSHIHVCNTVQGLGRGDCMYVCDDERVKDGAIMVTLFNESNQLIKYNNNCLVTFYRQLDVFNLHILFYIFTNNK